MDSILNNAAKDYLSAFHCILNKMIQDMTQAEKTNSISYNFIVQMIPHHLAAIEMSQNVLKYTTNTDLQKIASGIIEEQTKSIADMKQIQCRCLNKTNFRQDLKSYQEEINRIIDTMFHEMQNAPAGNRINCDFMQEMIPHHCGAVRMSKTALQYCICPELKPILDAIISSQEKGISEMRQLLSCIGCCR